MTETPEELSQPKRQELDEEHSLERFSNIVKHLMWIIPTFALGCSIGFYCTYSQEFEQLFPVRYDAKNWESLRGQFGALGDFFGGMLNPLLTFCTILMLIFSLLLQMRELKATRLELQRTRNAQQEQASEAKKQNTITQNQTDAINAQVEALKEQTTLQKNSSNQLRLQYLVDMIRFEENVVTRTLNMQCGDYQLKNWEKVTIVACSTASGETMKQGAELKNIIENSILGQHKILHQMIDTHSEDKLTQMFIYRVIRNTQQLIIKHGFFLKNDNRYEFIELFEDNANALTDDHFRDLKDQASELARLIEKSTFSN
ncbi:hypothetical protein [Pseudoalteromonas sp. S16_S37]|uniref:hypothetical protein n=1 Tax=Pseudoalteromonas sp. S16_S37 TaxID=2720228 RepID=UPI0016810C1F|nr:hypothetical protein [Pseudoalteromonas sp. S16_S37]MBD1584820.1 hypothetical protein [Pseudoalteromonas sp. S16_S37]